MWFYKIPSKISISHAVVKTVFKGENYVIVWLLFLKFRALNTATNLHFWETKLVSTQ